MGWRSELFLILRDSGRLVFCRQTTLYPWEGNWASTLCVHPGRLSNAHPAPCATLLSQESLAPMVKSICLSCQADASPPYDPGFLWSRRRKLVWMSVSEAEELKCWLSLTYHAENTHCLSLKPSKIPGLSRWSVTPFLWGHSLGLTLTSCMTSVAKCLHHFLKQFWGAFESTKLDSSCRAKFKVP